MSRDSTPCGPQLVCVDPACVRQIWPHAAPLLRAAIVRTGLSDFDQLERDLMAGDALLWIAASETVDGIAIEAVASTCLQKTGARTICVITACSGTHMARWLPLVEGIETYARDEGCDCVRIYGRKGWLRALDDYRQSHAILEKALY